MAPTSIMLYKEVGHSQEGAKELTSLLEAGVFDGPKPVRLLLRMITLANTDEDSIILDFFSGSATTAHAVMKQNFQDVIDSKKDKFMHFFLVFLIVLSSFAVIIFTVNGAKNLNTRIQAIEIANVTHEIQIEEDIEYYKKLTHNTPWENCNSLIELRDVTYNENNNAIYEELAGKIIILITELLANVIIVESVVKKEKDIFTE